MQKVLQVTWVRVVKLPRLTTHDNKLFNENLYTLFKKLFEVLMSRGQMSVSKSTII